ncbi:MAG: hypothetical protein RLZ59_1488, partial [Pseudomonadota bacterium]
VTSVNGASFVLGPSIGVGLYEIWGPLPYYLSAGILALLVVYVAARIKPIDHNAASARDA